MELPKFLLADHSEIEEAFVLHTEYPRFLLNVTTDDIEWFDDVTEDEDLENQVKNLIEEALDFFDAEMEAYDDEEDYGL